MPTSSLILCIIACFFNAGIEMAYGAWISSYIIIKNIGDKETGIICTSIFWISITVFLILFSFFPGKPTLKIRILTTGGIFISIASFFIIFFINHTFGLLTASIMIGLCDSALFGLIQVQLQELGFKGSRSQL